jgi:hypothetical protein
VGCNLTAEQDVSDSGLSIKASVDRSSYKIGDTLTLEVTPSTDAYITVIDQGSNPDVPERGHELFSDTGRGAVGKTTLSPQMRYQLAWKVPGCQRLKW